MRGAHSHSHSLATRADVKSKKGQSPATPTAEGKRRGESEAGAAQRASSLSSRLAPARISTATEKSSPPRAARWRGMAPCEGGFAK